jgi:hypothetical protein
LDETWMDEFGVFRDETLSVLSLRRFIEYLNII